MSSRDVFEMEISMLSPDELKQYGYFAGLSTSALEALYARMDTLEVEANTPLIRQLTPADYFYFLAQGEVEVSRRNRFGQTAKLAVLSCSHRCGSVTTKVRSRLHTQYVFVDARIPPEYEEEHIEGAVNIPIEILRARYGELDPDQPYVTYCTNDSRGTTAAFLLNEQGFHAMALRGGLSAWEGPVATGPSAGIHLPNVGCAQGDRQGRLAVGLFSRSGN